MFDVVVESPLITALRSIAEVDCEINMPFIVVDIADPSLRPCFDTLLTSSDSACDPAACLANLPQDLALRPCFAITYFAAAFSIQFRSAPFKVICLYN